MSTTHQPTNNPPNHILPFPFSHSPTPPALLTQGAEALVYHTHFPSPSTPCLLKYRPPKPYRHPTLDARLTKQRLLSEARMLLKCRRSGVAVPGVLGADWEAGWVAVEWIEGASVRGVLEEWEAERKTKVLQRRKRRRDDEAEGQEAVESTKEEELDEEDLSSLRTLFTSIGYALAALHEAGIVHGDLTTSNLMLQYNEPSASLATKLASPVVLIDFGLASSTLQHEDRAVDLYVLERAFAATHPGAEPHFHVVLEAYGGTGERSGKSGYVGERYKGAYETIKRLEGVRMRGRKRSMLG